MCFNCDHSPLVIGRSVGLDIPDAPNGTPIRIPDSRRYRKASPGVHLSQHIAISISHLFVVVFLCLIPNLDIRVAVSVSRSFSVRGLQLNILEGAIHRVDSTHR